MLYLVPTPIGNLADMTFRSIEVLKSVDLILCEDTRKSGKLLKHYEVKKPLLAYHQHNEHKLADSLMNRMLSGESMAIITDAGTPAISDPGFLLSRKCVEEGVEVQTLPGSTAFVPALLNSGLPCDRFVFEGFLPHKKGRQSRLVALAEEERTVVFYESPHRLLKTLSQLQELWGERKASVSRELTKIHEENIQGTFDELIAYYENNPLKGEIVLVVEGKEKVKKSDKNKKS